MARHKTEATYVDEPEQDPTLGGVAVLEAPSVEIETAPADEVLVVEAPKKVVVRVDWAVVMTHSGKQHGPWTINAVDESEAIQRAFDGPAKGLKRVMNKVRYSAKRVK